MTDRFVQYPNRYKLEKVEGTNDIYDLTPAPGTVTAEGTFLNKAALLKDATAAMFGLGTTAVPDDVLQELGKYKQHWWSARTDSSREGYKESLTDYTGGNPWIFANQNGNINVTIYKGISIDQSTGAITLTNPSTVTLYNIHTGHAAAQSACQTLAAQAPFYINGLSNNSGVINAIFYVPEGAIGANSSGDSGSRFTVFYNWGGTDSGTTIYIATSTAPVYAKKVTTEYYFIPSGTTEYLYSTDRNAYPDSGTVDGVEYKYLGIPLENAVVPVKIETGSYVGTGTYGSAKPNILTFSGIPAILIITTELVSTSTQTYTWAYPSPYMSYGSQYFFNYVSRSGKTASWYAFVRDSATDYSATQLNRLGTKYYYSAICL